MHEKIEAPYGSWHSPISADLIVKNAIGLSTVDPSSDGVIFSENRPSEKGRTALVLLHNGDCTDLLPKDMNARTTVHEYGGKSYLVDGDLIYFSNFSDQQLYQRNANGTIAKLTDEKNGRFADGCKAQNGLIYVYESHTEKGVKNCLVKIDAKGKVTPIATGWDFYAMPRVSPNQKQLAYYRWNLPNMPWDGGELVLADMNEDGTLQNERVIAGGQEESIAEIAWGPDQKLYYVSDRSNWWNLYCEGKNLIPMDAEMGLPHWVFGRNCFDFWKQSIVFVYEKKAVSHLALLKGGKVEEVPLPFKDISNPKVFEDSVYFLGSSPKIPKCIVKLNLNTKKWEVLKKSRELTINEADISEPRAIEFPTSEGKVAYGFYYPPTNAKYKGLPGETPPLLVLSHGGPTAHVSPSFNLRIQYWTSRGIAVVDVNYGGSTGYGREYRNRLAQNWGIVDVDDCTNAALYLAQKGLADPNRLTIAGGSAGGYTTLACLAFKDAFKAGACFYGVSDIEALANDTHKFESRYMDQLVGPYPEKKSVYVERSPIHHVNKMNCPIIIFQGDEDKIVPPSQSEVMYQSLLKREIPTAYLLFEKEQHGFRQAANIKRALEAQSYFFSKIFGYELADEVEPVEIMNLK